MIEICETLDGLPLGIELAAARMAAMSATEVRDRLGRPVPAADRPGVRTRSAVDPAARRGLVLRPAGRRRARRCCGRPRCSPVGFDLAALCAVAGDDDDVEMLRLLDSLVRKSLVVAHHGAAADPLQPLRDHPGVRRGAAAETDRGGTRDRHAAHFADEAVARWDRWNGPGWREPGGLGPGGAGQPAVRVPLEP